MAKRKYPKSAEDVNINNKDAYVSWGSANDTERQEAISQYSDAVSEFGYASLGSRSRDFSNLTTYQSGRPGLRSSDYDYFRSSEAVPTKSKEIIAFARNSYRRIGLIRNAIDLMGDFACQGIRLVHQNPRIEKFYNDWFNRVRGKFVSERLCNLLFREANVPIRMKTAKVDKKKKLEMQRSLADVDMKAIVNEKMFRKGEIPWHYIFLDPLLINVVGGSLSNMVGLKTYEINLPSSLRRQLNKISNSSNSEERAILQQVPEEILRAVESGKPVLLPPEKTFMLHYKKDDWQEWADPMTYACFGDLILYEKLKLADKAALDGAVNKIRVWKLGNLEHKLAPTATAASALGEILGSNVGAGTVDIVWGPDIELIETGTDVQRFLGEEKYRPTLMSIYSCLGIPPTLTGTFGASGTTNNFMSLKTLTERLNYVRGLVIEFWTHQIKLVQNAMGFRHGAQVEFDFMYLEDPASMTQLLINLADRNMISDEFVQRNVKAKPDVENNRINKESKKRGTGKMEEKVSPYHSVDKDFALQKIALQTGIVSPGQVGLELEEAKDGEQPALEMRKPKEQESGPPQEEVPPTRGPDGRPKNSRDKVPRKEREFKPKRRASIELWAQKAQVAIAKFVNPALLHTLSKKNMRSLSGEEHESTERIKFEILCNLDFTQEISERSIASSINGGAISASVHAECQEWISAASTNCNRRLSIEEIRKVKASFYVYFKETLDKRQLLV